MGLRGPQPKSAEMRVLEGERAHRPLPAPRPANAFGIPQRPKRMTAAAGRVWDYYIDQLAAAGRQIPSADALKRLCEDVAMLEDLQLGMRKKSADLKRDAKKEGKRIFGSGLLEFTMTHEGRRAIQTINATAARIRGTEIQFGLTPLSAARFEDSMMLPPSPAMTATGGDPSGIEAALCG